MAQNQSSILVILAQVILPPSIGTFWVCVPRIGSKMCWVGHPGCTRARRSHLYAGRSAIAKWILVSCHSSRQSASGISRGRGLTHASPSKFLQVMLDRLLSSSFYGPLGGFLGDPLFPIGHMMTSLHFLPMLCLFLVSQPIMAIPAKLLSCACAINPGGLLHPSFLLQLSKGKHLHITEHLLIKYFVCLGSRVLGK